MIRSIYSHPMWGKVQELKERGKYIEFNLSNEDGYLKYSFIKRYAGSINGIDYFDLVTPRGELGFSLTEGTLTDKLIRKFDEDFSDYCVNNNIIAEYVRFDPWNPLHEYFRELYNIISHGKEYCVNVKDDNFFQTQFSSKRRNQIRKALNYGLKVNLNTGEEGMNMLLNLYKYTDEKYQISNYYKIDQFFLQRYVDLMGDRVSYCTISYDGLPISVGMFLRGEDIFHYHFSANNPEYLNLNGSSLMIYEECKKAQYYNCTWLDLGGATPGSGLEKFKRSWCSQTGILDNYVGTKIRNIDIYQQLIAINGMQGKGYFPEYKRVL